MSTNSHAKTSAGQINLAKIVFRTARFFGLQGVLLFATAGRLNWGTAWTFLFVHSLAAMISMLVTDPDLAVERSQRKENVKGWDRALLNVITPLMFFILIVAGLDARNGWSVDVSPAVQVVGLTALSFSYLLMSWAIAVNKYFATYVRIQEDRGHTVATGGPYRYVRHPGYLAMIILHVAIPPALDSWWALGPAVLVSLLFIVRTALEDRTLREELAGYADYARRVRYRLIPGVW